MQEQTRGQRAAGHIRLVSTLDQLRWKHETAIGGHRSLCKNQVFPSALSRLRQAGGVEHECAVVTRSSLVLRMNKDGINPNRAGDGRMSDV